MNKDIDNLIGVVVDKLKIVPGVKAVVLGGSRADGSNRPDSDIDLGIYYDDKKIFDLETIRKLAQELNDIPNPVVTSIGQWGKWVNGGAWLTINGQRVDFLYRDLNFVKQIVQECKSGIKQSDYYQQPPYGFHSYMYCAEIQVCKVLFDPDGVIGNLKLESKEYPKALKSTIINGSLWDTEFTLVHCKKSAQRGEVIIVAGCLTKIASDFVQVLYALNEVYFIGEKKLYKQVPLFKIKPNNFLERINKILGVIGTEAIQIKATVDEAETLFNDFVTIAGSEYKPKFKI